MVQIHFPGSMQTRTNTKSHNKDIQIFALIEFAVHLLENDWMKKSANG